MVIADLKNVAVTTKVEAVNSDGTRKGWNNLLEVVEQIGFCLVAIETAEGSILAVNDECDGDWTNVVGYAGCRFTIEDTQGLLELGECIVDVQIWSNATKLYNFVGTVIRDKDGFDESITLGDGHHVDQGGVDLFDGFAMHGTTVVYQCDEEGWTVGELRSWEADGEFNEDVVEFRVPDMGLRSLGCWVAGGWGFNNATKDNIFGGILEVEVDDIGIEQRAVGFGDGPRKER